MKVAIISSYFLQTTIPLAKHLSEKVEVDLYCIFSNTWSKNFIFNIDVSKQPLGLSDIDSDSGMIDEPMLRYLGKSIKVKMFIHNNLGKKKIIKDYLLARSLAQHIRAQNYDVLNIIGQSIFLYFLHKLLKDYPITHTLHETYNRTENIIKWREKILLSYLKRSKSELIFHSDESLNAYKKYLKVNTSRLNKIYFGLLDYLPYYSNQNIEEENNTILYFGIIREYKGIHVLVEASKKICNELIDFKVILAGGGKYYFDIDNIKNDNHFKIINKELSNTEIVNLILRSKIIICPYLNSSQSGIPMAAYVFNKPIIASQIGGLKEVVDDCITGILVPPNDPDVLAREILNLLRNEHRRILMKNNIRKKFVDSDLSWSTITSKTIDVYNKEIAKYNNS